MYQTVKLWLCSMVGGLGLTYMAVTNDRGLVLNGVLKFSQTGATVFYAVVGALCLVMAVVSGRSLWRAANVGEASITSAGLQSRNTPSAFAATNSKANDDQRFFS